MIERARTAIWPVLWPAMPHSDRTYDVPYLDPVISFKGVGSR
jgi:hypothetical protein